MTLEQLAVDHDYYCSTSNYYSNEAHTTFRTWADFYEEYHNADIDMNLIFRWDIKKREESGRYWAEIFMMGQRKGLFRPIVIDYIDEKDVDSFITMVHKHWEKLLSIWAPISTDTNIKPIG